MFVFVIVIHYLLVSVAMFMFISCLVLQDSLALIFSFPTLWYLSCFVALLYHDIYGMLLQSSTMASHVCNFMVAEKILTYTLTISNYYTIHIINILCTDL